MNELPELKFGALLRSRNTQLCGHYIRISRSRHCGPTYQVMDVYPPAVHSLGGTTIIFPNDYEIIRAEPTAEDIQLTNAALAARAAARCKYKVGDTVIASAHGDQPARRVVVTYVVPVFNDYIPDSYRLRCTDPTGKEGNWIEADQCVFSPIEEELAQCS